jgi:RNA polymerase sigma-70 factor (ECF subfamily)
MVPNSGWDAAAQLVGAAAAGDRLALSGLIRATQRDVWRYLACQVGAGEADDLTQETYLRAVGALPRFEGRSSVRTWLLVIARRVVIDHLRRRAVRAGIVDVPDWQALADRDGRSAPAEFTDLAELELLLAGLSVERREAIVLTQVLGFSYAEAALICQCPIGTIRSRVARARERPGCPGRRGRQREGPIRHRVTP